MNIVQGLVSSICCHCILFHKFDVFNILQQMGKHKDTFAHNNDSSFTEPSQSHTRQKRDLGIWWFFLQVCVKWQRLSWPLNDTGITCMHCHPAVGDPWWWNKTYIYKSRKSCIYLWSSLWAFFLAPIGALCMAMQQQSCRDECSSRMLFHNIVTIVLLGQLQLYQFNWKQLIATQVELINWSWELFQNTASQWCQVNAASSDIFAIYF